ncbi:MAG: hypothetical protein AAFQ98_11195 [Bacteroidota bacterium]
MSVIDRLASSLNRRDEVPNQELAHEIVLANDAQAVKELVQNLTNQRAIQNDCIKVLYEIGSQQPMLIADYLDEFIAGLHSKNNRLQWGAMTALYTITAIKPKEIYAALPSILAAADKGSVITKDHAVNILIELGAQADFSEGAFPLLIEQLEKSPANQFPMYAERASAIINDNNKSLFVKTLVSKLEFLEKESKRKRVEKLIKKFR